MKSYEQLATEARETKPERFRPDITTPELQDALATLQRCGWSGYITMGDAIRTLAEKSGQLEREEWWL